MPTRGRSSSPSLRLTELSSSTMDRRSPSPSSCSRHQCNKQGTLPSTPSGSFQHEAFGCSSSLLGFTSFPNDSIQIAERSFFTLTDTGATSEGFDFGASDFSDTATLLDDLLIQMNDVSPLDLRQNMCTVLIECRTRSLASHPFHKKTPPCRMCLHPCYRVKQAMIDNLLLHPLSIRHGQYHAATQQIHKNGTYIVRFASPKPLVVLRHSPVEHQSSKIWPNFDNIWYSELATYCSSSYAHAVTGISLIRTFLKSAMVTRARNVSRLGNRRGVQKRRKHNGKSLLACLLKRITRLTELHVSV